MKKKFIGLVTIISLIAISCTSDDDVESSSYSNDDFKINSNAEDLQNSINLEGSGVLGVKTVNSSGSTKNTVKDSETVQEISLGLEQIAFIEPPVLNGNSMRANHVDIHGDFAYVAYMKEGSTYLGGIDIIDISDRFQPKVVSRMTTDVADINALYFEANKIYFTGAAMSNSVDRAIVGVVSSVNGQFTSEVLINSLTGQAGVDILPFGDNVMVLTGSDGSIGLYDSNDLVMQQENWYSDLRSAAYLNGKLIALSGDSGLLFLNSSSLDQEKTVNIPGLIAESKRTMAFLGDLLMVSEGPNGVGLYDPNSGSLVTRLPIQLTPDVEVTPEDKVTNAVSSADGFILMSNGGAGFGISRLDQNNRLAEEGIVEINGSSNYIKAAGDYIFVASGAGGLRIIKMSKPVVDTNEGIFADCGTYENYDGNQNLNINSNEEKAFSGSTTIKSLNVNNLLTFCGSLNVQQSANINSNAIFNMKGALAVGTYGSNSHLNINSGSVLRIRGELTVYGDLNLNSGATIEFLGDNSSIHVYGEVRKNSGITITGNYTDTSNKL